MRVADLARGVMRPGTRLMLRGEPHWPDHLDQLSDPPRALWMVGTDYPRWPAVSIVGSRQSTVVGREIAREVARTLGARGVQVISGFARGIDEAAHRGALEGGGSTIAVLGCGLDVAYPRGHEDLRRAVAASGLLVSEDAGSTPPEAWRFPRRNRIIAALAAAVIVIEATTRSGALSTARWAADLGREVLAVPGSIRSDRSEGTNRLIRDGARPFLSVDDVYEAVPGLRRLEPPINANPGTGPVPATHDDQPAWSRRILECVGADAVHPDDIASKLGVPAAALSAQLMQLELVGVVRTESSGCVARVF